LLVDYESTLSNYLN